MDFSRNLSCQCRKFISVLRKKRHDVQSGLRSGKGVGVFPPHFQLHPRPDYRPSYTTLRCEAVLLRACNLGLRKSQARCRGNSIIIVGWRMLILPFCVF